MTEKKPLVRRIAEELLALRLSNQIQSYKIENRDYHVIQAKISSLRPSTLGMICGERGDDEEVILRLPFVFRPHTPMAQLRAMVHVIFAQEMSRVMQERVANFQVGGIYRLTRACLHTYSRENEYENCVRMRVNMRLNDPYGYQCVDWDENEQPLNPPGVFSLKCAQLHPQDFEPISL